MQNLSVHQAAKSSRKNPFITATVLTALFLVSPSTPAQTNFTLRFDRAIYTVARGATFPVNVLLDPLPTRAPLSLAAFRPPSAAVSR